MKRFALLVLVPFLLAADWPKKGDTVYISRTLEAWKPSTVDAYVRIDICSPAIFISGTSKSRVAYLKARTGEEIAFTEKAKGDWRKYFYASHNDCLDSISH